MINPEAFWARVPNRPAEPAACWEFASRVARYPTVWTGERQEKAHRLAYQLEVGPIPDGYVIDHLCRNARCVRPSHLEAVTLAENTIRANRGRIVAPTCKRGHPRAADYRPGEGSCRECRNIQHREWRADPSNKARERAQGRVKYWRDPDAARAKRIRLRNADPEHFIEYQRAWRAAHPEKGAEYAARYREGNLERVKARRRAHYDAHREERRAEHRAFYAANRERELERARIYRARKRAEATDPE